MIKKVFNWIENHQEEMTDFLKEFIEYKSIPGNEKKVQNEFLKPFLKEKMNWTEIELVNKSENEERPNLNAYSKGKGNGRNLLFNGHIDVVDIPENRKDKWDQNPWEPIEKEGKIYGRGANDMKGPDAAIIWAIKALMDLEISLKGDVLLSLVVGEESAEQEIGTIYSVKKFEEKNIDIPFCINGEPTNNEIHTKSSGTFDFRIVIDGKEAHTCQKNLIKYPQRFDIPHGNEIGKDSIPIMSKVLERLESLEHQWNMRYKDKIYGGGGFPNHDYQGVGIISICPTIITAGEYISSIAGQAEIKGQIYYPPFVDEEKLWREMKKSIESISHTDDWLKENPIELNHKEQFHWPPFEVDYKHPGCKTLGKAFKEVKGEKPIYSGFKAVADNSFIQKNFNIPTISFGPGDLSMGAHGANEHMTKKQLIEASKVYADMILKWCN